MLTLAFSTQNCHDFGQNFFDIYNPQTSGLSFSLPFFPPSLLLWHKITSFTNKYQGWQWLARGGQPPMANYTLVNFPTSEKMLDHLKIGSTVSSLSKNNFCWWVNSILTLFFNNLKNFRSNKGPSLIIKKNSHLDMHIYPPTTTTTPTPQISLAAYPPQETWLEC